MRKALAAVVFVVAIVGLLAPPVFAQAPAPKVTINGLVDFVTTAYGNWSGGTCPTGCDVTDGGRDRGWYSRERGVFTITGEVGKTKGVWAIELDFTNGAGVSSGGNAFNGGLNGTAFPGTSANMDLDTDVASATETKWLYLETPVTGPGSIMPFIPVPTIGRFGAQPSRGHEFKNGILLAGDMPGATFETAWAPTVNSTVTYVQIGERLDKVLAPVQNEDYAILASVNFEIFKGLVVKPTYAYARYENGNSGTLNLGTEAKGGFNPNAVAGLAHPVTSRHTFGGDVRWTSGPFSLQPTLLVQLGKQDITPVTRGTRRIDDVDIHSFIFDTIGGFRTGPFNLEGRIMYTPGQDAQQLVQNGADVSYYQPINPGFGYMAGWTDIQTSGVDYITALFAGTDGVSLRTSPSYDKYGRIFAAVAADYSLTPALTFHGVLNWSWTDKKVDTDGIFGATGIVPANRGDARYLGTELNLGLTYRFAPNVALDLMGAYMWTGDAMDHARTAGGGCSGDARGNSAGSCSADDIYKATARVRLTF